MAPNVSLADRIEKLTAIVVGEHLASRPPGTPPGVPGLDAGQLAARCGTTVAEVSDWYAGLSAPTTDQALAWLGAITDAQRARRASYAMQVRQGHAGSDVYYGGHERDVEGVQAAVDRLAAAFPGWTIRVPPGAETLGTEHEKRLVWRAVRTAEPDWPDVVGATSWELQHKVEQVEASMAAEAEAQARYADGRGVSGRPASRKA